LVEISNTCIAYKLKSNVRVAFFMTKGKLSN
jgi:hypothetical protein